MRSPRRWWRTVRARRPGLYLYRTRRHLRPGSQWGYAGLSNRLDLRDAQHKGKPWYDLVIYRLTFQLPWWLGWRWVLAPLETLLILAALPRYNWSKNPRPGKCGPRQQQAERLIRDTTNTTYVTHAAARDWLYRLAAASIILVGIGGYLWDRV